VENMTLFNFFPHTTRILKNIFLISCLLSLTNCSIVDRFRFANDLALSQYQKFNIETLVEAEKERQRLRKARCYSPFLTPATISAAAEDPRLGPQWVEELLDDCPHFSAFIAELLLRRAENAGLIPRGRI
jgi:hypothetical protein